MRTGMVCSPVPALMIWQVPPVRNSPRQFEKGGNPASQAPVRAKAHHAAVIMAGKRQIDSI